MMKTFTSTGPPFTITGRSGLAFPTRLHRDYSSRAEMRDDLIGQEIMIDGRLGIVRGIETFAVNIAPYEGWSISLLVDLS